MAKENLSPLRLRWRKIHSYGDHGEGSSIVVDTENLNCPRPSTQGPLTDPNTESGVSDTYIFDPSQKNWRNSWSIFKISYTWNATVSVELRTYIELSVSRLIADYHWKPTKSDEKLALNFTMYLLTLHTRVSFVIWLVRSRCVTTCNFFFFNFWIKIRYLVAGFSAFWERRC